MQTTKTAIITLPGGLLLAALMLGPSQAGSFPDLKSAVNASHDGIVSLVRGGGGGGHGGGGWGGHMGGGWGGHMGGGWGGHMGGRPRFVSHRGGGSPSFSRPSGGGRVANHSANDFVHPGQFKIVHNPNVDHHVGDRSENHLADTGQFKMVHNPNVENSGANQSDNNVVRNDGQFKMVHNPNVENRGNHLGNDVVRNDGQFKIARSTNFDNRRLDANHLDNDLVEGSKFVHNSNFDHRFNRHDFDNDLFDDLFDLFDDGRFRNVDNFFFFGGFPWWWGIDVSNCWVWWPDDGWVWQCS